MNKEDKEDKEVPSRHKGLWTKGDARTGRFLDISGFQPQAMKEGTYLGVTLRHSSLVNDIVSGLPTSSIESLRSYLEVNQETMIRYISISNGTYARRKEGGQLNTQESACVFRYAHLLGLATEMTMGDEEKAKAWLKASKEILGGVTPLEYAETEIGARAVEDYINRIMDGTYS